MTLLPTAAGRPPDAATRRVLAARTGVAVVFACNGLAVASWFARVPAARDALGLTAGRLGVLLLAMSAGAVLALTTAGAVADRIGPAGTVTIGVVLVAAGSVTTGTGVDARLTPLVAVGLVVLGYGSGMCQVAMNVEAATVERRLGRSIMPRFHAAWSVGTMVAAGGAAAAAAGGMPVVAHLGLVAAVALTGTLCAVRPFLSRLPRPSGASPGRTAGTGGALAAWREPRTLFVGLLVLVVAFAEGSANEWVAVAFVDGHGFSAPAGAAVFGVFVAAMTAGRLAGSAALDRWGRAPVLLVTLLLAGTGTATAVLAGSAAVAVAGVAVWGLGTALGFPVGMSAAADDATRAAARVGVVSVLGYTAFLAGPPVVGLVADHTGTLRALLVVPLLVLPALALVPAIRRPA